MVAKGGGCMFSQLCLVVCIRTLHTYARTSYKNESYCMLYMYHRFLILANHQGTSKRMTKKKGPVLTCFATDHTSSY